MFLYVWLLLVTLIVPDCDGKCIVELPSRFIEVGGTSNVTITFQNLKKPVTAMYLMILKAEHVEDVSIDQVALGEVLFELFMLSCVKLAHLL